MSWSNGTERAQLYSDDFAAAVSLTPDDDPITGSWQDASGSDVVDVMLEVDVNTYLPGDLITKIDIATMAYALEARSPLLDHELMEFAASIPADLKVRGREKKWIFREALRGWLPDETLDRPKQGFSVPIADWFRNELHDLVHDVLLDASTLDHGYFRPQTVRSMLERHTAGRRFGDQAALGAVHVRAMASRIRRPLADAGDARGRGLRNAVQPRILIVSPVRNEAAHIERVVRVGCRPGAAARALDRARRQLDRRNPGVAAVARSARSRSSMCARSRPQRRTPAHATGWRGPLHRGTSTWGSAAVEWRRVHARHEARRRHRARARAISVQLMERFAADPRLDLAGGVLVEPLPDGRHATHRNPASPRPRRAQVLLARVL